MNLRALRGELPIPPRLVDGMILHSIISLAMFLWSLFKSLKAKA